MTVMPANSTNFTINHSSPLDALVRRTSSRAAGAKSSRSLSTNIQSTNDQHHYGPPQAPPHSPLLHAQFARDSTAASSTNDNHSYLAPESSLVSRNSSNYHYFDDESIYSTDFVMRPAGALTNSMSSHDMFMNPRPAPAPSGFSTSYSVPNVAPNLNAMTPPAVVVSSADATREGEDASTRSAVLPHVGRAPVVRPVTSNFSRPARVGPSDQQVEDSLNPHRPSLEAEGRKRQILDRNAGRPGASPATRPSPRNSPLSNEPVIAGVAAQISHDEWPDQIHTLSSSSNFPTPGARVPSPSGSQSPRYPASQIPNAYSEVMPNAQHLETKLSAPTLSPISRSTGSNHDTTQPRSLQPGNITSVYSTYSYYQYDSEVPSPIGSNFPVNPTASSEQLVPATASSSQQHLARDPDPPPQSPLTEQNAKTPQDFLQLGIKYHEANHLKQSAACFEQSAKWNGGCAMGMLMWGLALRHGWGCEKDEKHAFTWLRRAAELAVTGLEKAAGGPNMIPFRGELVLAIYEVGQCFFQGWGVPKDQKMAVEYYTVAAKLGDADAQTDLGYCLANGKGCKKDRKAAARWYRAAVAQGQSSVGLAWIYKEKFQ